MQNMKAEQAIFDRESSVATFIEVLAPRIDKFINDGLINNQYSDDQITSAKKANDKMIGIGFREREEFYLFPELLLEHLKNQYMRDHIPADFFSIEKLQKMLTREDLIIRDNDNRVEFIVPHNGVMVKAWQLDLQEFMRRRWEFLGY